MQTNSNSANCIRPLSEILIYPDQNILVSALYKQEGDSGTVKRIARAFSKLEALSLHFPFEGGVFPYAVGHYAVSVTTALSCLLVAVLEWHGESLPTDLMEEFQSALGWKGGEDIDLLLNPDWFSPPEGFIDGDICEWIQEKAREDFGIAEKALKFVLKRSSERAAKQQLSISNN